jgi:hypothetical protein
MAPSPVFRMPVVEPITKVELRGDSFAKAKAELNDLLYATTHRDRNSKRYAAEIGIATKRLYDAANPTEGKPFCVRWIVPLMRAANDYSVLRWMAEACGFVIHETPKATADPHDLVRLMGEVTRETGDVLSVLGVALADGRVCPEDARLASKEVDELLARAHLIRHTLTRIAGAGR